MKVMLLWSLAIVALLLLLGYTYQVIRLRNLSDELPAPGEFARIGDSSLHYRLLGEGRPLVLLEQGPGATSLDWALLAPQLAEVTGVLIYDRAGLAWSGDAHGRRIASRLARERHELIAYLAGAEPVIIVGHSGGGLFARTHCHLYPEDIAALVLIDSSHEKQLDVTRGARANLGRQRMVLRIAYWASQFGAIELLRSWREESVLPEAMGALPSSARRALSRFFASPRHWSGVLAEFTVLEESAEELAQLAQARDLGSLPLVVLTGGESNSAQHDIWLELQRDLASRSDRAEHIVVAGAGHYIHEDRPEVVVDVIHELVQRIRTSKQIH